MAKSWDFELRPEWHSNGHFLRVGFCRALSKKTKHVHFNKDDIKFAQNFEIIRLILPYFIDKVKLQSRRKYCNIKSRRISHMSVWIKNVL